MTNKQKLIEYLYKYTSKELSFGCEVVEPFGGKTVTLIEVRSEDRLNKVYTLRKEDGREWVHITQNLNNPEVEKYKILGHPPQWHHLLLALEEPVDEVYISGTGEIVYVQYGEEETLCKVGLTTNLQDIPEDTAEKLVELLNIK